MSNLAKSAELHWTYYRQVKAVLATEHADAPYWPEWEDYLADAVAYDVYSEDPAEYVRENGERRTAPLTSGRRAHLKELGFTFHTDGSVRYLGTDAHEWAEAHTPKPEPETPALPATYGPDDLEQPELFTLETREQLALF